MECYECPNYQTEACTWCNHPTLEELPIPAEMAANWWDSLFDKQNVPLADRLYCLIFFHQSGIPFHYKVTPVQRPKQYGVITDTLSINPSDMDWINSGKHYAGIEVKGGIYPDPNDEEIPF